MNLYPAGILKQIRIGFVCFVIASALTSLGVYAQGIPIRVTRNPQPQLVQEGASAMFSVTASSDSPVFYQWLKNGTNIPGASRSSLSLSQVAKEDMGLYSVQIANTTKTIVTEPVALNIYPAGTLPFRAVQRGSGSITFIPEGIDCGPNCRAYPAGTKVKITIEAASGWYIDDFTFPDCATDECAFSRIAFTQAKQQAGSANSSLITNWAYSTTLTTSRTVDVKITPPPPVITIQPQSQAPRQRTDVTLLVAATGTGELTYQWFFKKFPLQNATEPTLRFSGIQPWQAGPYFAVVTSSGSSVTSQVAVVTVRAENDDFNTSLQLDGYGRSEIQLENRGATAEPGEPEHGGTGGASVWLSWTAPASGRVMMSTMVSNFDTLLAVYTGDSVTNLTLVAKDDQSGGNDTSKLIMDAQAGVTYHIAIDGYKGATGSILFDVVMEEIHIIWITRFLDLLDIRISGKVDSTFTLETSTDLVTWTVAHKDVIGSRGSGFFSIRWPTDSKRFFRVSTP